MALSLTLNSQLSFLINVPDSSRLKSGEEKQRKNRETFPPSPNCLLVGYKKRETRPSRETRVCVGTCALVSRVEGTGDRV